MAQVQGITTTQPTQAPVAVPQPAQQPGQNQTGPLVVKANGNGQTAVAAAPETAVAANVTANAAASTVVNSANAGSINMANPKEKTPMCLLNELARYNKMQPQYNLVDESGPAHQKTFEVSLTLNDKVYKATGTSIKKAQHEAAEIALKQCGLPSPKPRPPRVIINGSLESMTPTVELNGIAMKRGEQAIYRAVEPAPPHLGPGSGPGPGPRGPPPSFYNNRPNYNFRGMYNQRYHYPMNRATACYVSLTVGNREFYGEGRTRQQARHNAAVKALKALRNEPLPEGVVIQQPENVRQVEDESDGDESKSEISQCYEIAHRRNFPITFEVIKESGPPHMKTFITRCSVGEYSAEAEGNGKKVSKKKAAAKVLDQLRELTPLPVIEKPRPRFKKKKPKSLVKTVQQSNQDYGLGMNPVSRLVQIQQAKKEKEPVFTLLQERGQPRKREFVMQVTVGNSQCTGIGPNKKMAKRAAAEAMLQELGYRSNPPLPNKSSLKTEGAEVQTLEEKPANGRKVTFADSEKEENKSTVPEGGGTGVGLSSRPLAPGLLPMMPEVANAAGFTLPTMAKHQGLNRAPGAHLGDPVSKATTALIARELLVDGESPTADGIAKSRMIPKLEQKLLRPKSQLMYLAKVQGLNCEFTDFPKGNKPEYLCLVTVSTTPSLISHGAGPTVESSHDAASLQALKTLMDMDIKAVVEHIKKDPGTPTDKSIRSDVHTKTEDVKTEQMTTNSLDTNSPSLISHGAGPTVESSHDAASIQALKSLTLHDMTVVEHIKKEPGTPTDKSIRPDVHIKTEDVKAE